MDTSTEKALLEIVKVGDATQVGVNCSDGYDLMILCTCLIHLINNKDISNMMGYLYHLIETDENFKTAFENASVDIPDFNEILHKLN